MRRKFTQVMMLSLLLAGAATAIGNFVYAANDKAPAKVTAKAAGVPYKPTNLSATVGDLNEDGSANVTLSFTTPSRYYDEDEWEPADGLDELTEIAVYELVEEDYWTTTYNLLTSVTEDLEIGADMTIVLENQASGSHNYRVYALNSESSSTIKSNYYSYAAVSVKVGYDAPAAVGDLAISKSGNDVTITWSAPTAGAEGGAFRAEGMTYDIYRYEGTSTKGTKIATDIEDLTYTDQTSYSQPTQVSYGVSAKNQDGESSVSKTGKVIVGAGYTLPFSETFSDGSPSNLWASDKNITEFSVSTSISSSRGLSTGFNSTLKTGYDGDSGALYFKCNSTYFDEEEDEVEESYGTYTSATISLAGATVPSLKFYHYVIPNSSNNLKTTIIIEADGEQNTLATYTYNDMEGEEGWVARSFDLSQFNGKEITLIFRGDCTNDTPGFTAFDNITIEESRDFDLVLNSFTADENVDAGKEFAAAAEVFNKGAKDAENFEVELLLNGEVYTSEKVETLASGETTTVNFSGTAVNSFGNKAKLSARVVFEADEDTSNNDSSEATLSVKLAATPEVQNPAFEVNDNSVVLSWSEPDYLLPANEQVTESFEDYSDGDTSFGSWTMSSAHKYGVSFDRYGLDEDAYTGSATFTVTNAVEDDWYGKPASGDNYLMKTNNNTDYLYSPVLSGNEQTISFAVASRHQEQLMSYDTFDDEDAYDVVKVLYSTTDNEQSSFKKTVVNEEITSVLKKGDDYQTITADLPDGAKYFAIVISAPEADGFNYDNDTKSIVFIDDITFEKGSDGIQAVLVGYNVYENDVKLNEEPVTETSFTVDNPTAEATYYIAAVYNVGDSELTEALKKSAVEAVEGANIQIYSTVGTLHITGAEAAAVYDLIGRKVAQTRGDVSVALPAGAYIVRADSITRKVLVK